MKMPVSGFQSFAAVCRSEDTLLIFSKQNARIDI